MKCFHESHCVSIDFSSGNPAEHVNVIGHDDKVGQIVACPSKCSKLSATL